MINLLPPDIKQEYRYARRNRRLIRWIAALAIVLIGAGALTGGGLFYMQHSIDTYSQQVARTDELLKAQNLPSVQKQVTEISNNLKLVVQVLSKEVLFSDMLKQLGKVTPSNVILTGLSIAQTQGGIDITAQTADYGAATQLQLNLADPKNKIFDKADIVGINCSSDAANKAYPCTATIRALFAAQNPFLFINSSAKAAS